MKITIVGANSWFARNFIAWLRNKAGVIIKAYGFHENCASPDVKYYERIDFSDDQSVSKIDFDCDLLYIFSGVTDVSNSFDNIERINEINIKQLYTMLRIMAEKKAGCRLVYPSSRLVYKDNNGAAFKEDDALEPKSPYALSKITAEHMIRMYSNCFGLSYTIFRVAILFGSLLENAEQPSGIVYKFIDEAKTLKTVTVFGDGTQRRTFTHITDACQLFYSVPLEDYSNNETYNVGGTNHSLIQMAHAVAEKNHAKVNHCEWPEKYKRMEVFNGLLDSSKLDKLAKHSYKDIMKDFFPERL